MNEFTRGDEVLVYSGHTDDTELAFILGPEDFDSYEYNKPNRDFELVQYSNGLRRVWVGRPSIQHIEDQL